MTKIQESVKEIEGVQNCVYNNECYSLTVYVKSTYWSKLDRIKIKLSSMLQVKNLDRFFERIIYTPSKENVS